MVFDDVRWSTKDSFNDLIRNCENPAILDESFDLNRIEDILKLDAEMLSNCPRLKRFIKSFIQEKIMDRREIVLNERN